MGPRGHSRRQFLGRSLTAAATLLSGCGQAGSGPASRASAGKEGPMTTLTVGEGRYRGDTNAAIQRAVDAAAAAGGGTVVIPPGTYRMHDALHLRSGVRVVGREGAVLKKVPSVTSRIPDFLGYGHYEVTVEEPEKFPLGTGVHILDEGAGGFYTTVATVVGRDGERLFINRMLNHDYHVRKNARVISVFPIVEAEGVEGAAVEGLTLDGNLGEETVWLNGCRGGGVFLIRSSRVAVRRVEVKAFRGDAISFQQCTDILVEHCHVHDNAGHGLHPGSGSVRYVMQDNRVHGNGDCGLFYCLRTTHSVCRRNDLSGNGRAGISVGERDTDHLLEGNTLAGNGHEGILFREPVRCGGDRVIISGCTIGPNGTKEARPEIALPPGLADVHVLDNAFMPGPGPVLTVAQGCRHISFCGNRIGGREVTPADLKGLSSLVRGERPARLPPVGPAALPLDGARHLNIPRLPPWNEQWM